MWDGGVVYIIRVFRQNKEFWVVFCLFLGIWAFLIFGSSGGQLVSRNNKRIS